MVEKIVTLIVGLFAGFSNIPFGKELIVFIISLMPILELRGGLIAASLLGLDPVRSYIISIIGNIIPVPFILWLINYILEYMRKSKKLSKIAIICVLMTFLPSFLINFSCILLILN